MAIRWHASAPAAKLAAPSAPAAVLVRPALQARLAQAPAGLWIGSPAASGKTVLAATTLAAAGRPVCWLQLDTGDADPGSFFHFLALAAARLPAPHRLQPLPTFGREVGLGLVDFARIWFQALFARLPADCVVVLDDWHWIPDTSPLQATLVQALTALPAGMSLWVLSRHAPAPALDAARVRGRLTALSFADLALTPDELQAMLIQRTPGARHDPRALAQQAGHWHDWCEGWIGALVFALATGRVEPASLPALAAADTSSTVFGFLSAELFEQSAPAVQEFMLVTAWMPHVTETLARRALPGLDVAVVIAELARRSLLLGVDSGRGRSWRYHRLLREFLQHRAREVWGDTRLAERLKALAAMLLAADLPEAAAALHIAAHDSPGLTRLLLHQAPGLLRAGRFATLVAWVDALPQAERSPWVRFWHASALLARDVRASALEFEQAYLGFWLEADVDGLYRSWCGAVEANTYACDDYRVLQLWLQRLGELRARFARAPSFTVRAQVWVYGFSAVFFSDPQTPEFGPWLRNVRRLYRLLPRRADRLAVGGLLGLYHSAITGMGGLRAHMLALRPLLDDDALPPFHRLVGSLPDIIQHWIGGSTDDALVCLQRYARLAHDTGAHALDHQLAFQSAYVHGVRRDLVALDHQLRTLAPLLPALGRIDVAQHDFLAGWRAALAGRLDEALHLLERSVDNASRHRFAFFEAIGGGLLAELRAMAGDFDGARRQAERAMAVAAGMDSVTALVPCRMQRAAVAELAGDDDAALRPLLQEALSFARRHGHWAWGGLMPATLSRLAQRALALDIEPGFVTELIRRRELVPPPQSLHHPAWPRPLRVLAFGSLQLLTPADQQDLRSGQGAQRPLDLLRALLCQAPSPLPVQTALAWLWPDTEASDQRKVFDVTLHRLRKLLGAEQALRMDGGKLFLDAQQVWTDIAALSSLLQAVPAPGEGPAPAGRAAAAAQAAMLRQLVRGSLMDGDDAPWIQAARERWRRRIGLGAAHIGDALASPDEQLQLLQALFDADPAAWPVARQLAQWHVQRHDLQQAQQVWDLCARMRHLAGEVPLGAELPGLNRQPPVRS